MYISKLWFWTPILILVIASILLGIFLWNTSTELSNTKAILSDTQNELDATQKELTYYKSTDNGQVLEAKRNLDAFMAAAINKQYSNMWNLLYPDSKSIFTGIDDFSSNNSVATNGYYGLSQYFIGEGKLLAQWRNYSNVAEVKVMLVKNKDAVTSFIIGFIPLIGDINKMMPGTTFEENVVHLVKINNQWTIFCDRTSVAASSSSSNQQVNTEVTTYNDSGISHYNNGDYSKAIADFTKAIELDPKLSTTVYANRGFAYSKNGEYVNAIADLTKAIELDPKNTAFYCERGFDYEKTTNYDNAIADYTKAIELDPKKAIAYNNRGGIYFDKGQYDKAIADYNKAIEVDSNNAACFINRGNTYYKKGDKVKAQADWQKAKDLGYTATQ